MDGMTRDRYNKVEVATFAGQSESFDQAVKYAQDEYEAWFKRENPFIVGVEVSTTSSSSKRVLSDIVFGYVMTVRYHRTQFVSQPHTAAPQPSARWNDPEWLSRTGIEFHSGLGWFKNGVMVRPIHEQSAGEPPPTLPPLNADGSYTGGTQKLDPSMLPPETRKLDDT